MAQDTNNSTKDIFIGKQLGDYRLTSKLASGGMARVYKAMDYKLQRQAAVKVLEKEKAEDDKTLTARFQREARAVAALEHDNIITIYQYGEDEDVYFLAMKLVKGRDLANELGRLRRTKKLMSIERALHIMKQVASALDYAHAAGIIHRDIKPSNILLDKDDKAILTDFGLVLRASSHTTMGTAFGTPRYIAPEQAVSSNKALPQSDIYALGVIMYEILTGTTPFNGDSPMEIALSQISDPPPPPREHNPDIPEAVEKELLRALEKEPEKRHKTASELIKAISSGYTQQARSSELQQAALDLDTNATLPPPVSISSSDNNSGTDTLNVRPDTDAIPLPVKRQNSSLPFVLMALVALLITGAFIVNGMNSGPALTPTAEGRTPEATVPVLAPVSSSSGGGAPVVLIYDGTTFTMINEGDYELFTQQLMFIRGTEGGGDDFSGDRVPRDRLAAGKCYQISLQGQPASVPPQCEPIADKRVGLELLLEPRSFHWRTESTNDGRIPTFEVRFEGELLARCDTVTADGVRECRFNWPVVPTPEAG